jgi:hypothetical protein
MGFKAPKFPSVKPSEGESGGEVLVSRSEIISITNNPNPSTYPKSTTVASGYSLFRALLQLQSSGVILSHGICTSPCACFVTPHHSTLKSWFYIPFLVMVHFPKQVTWPYVMLRYYVSM